MIYTRVFIVKLFISIVLCKSLRNNDSSRLFSKNTTRNIQNLPTADITSKHNVRLTVHYETLCPASISFFVTQLKFTVQKLGAHLDVNLIPYGHAKTYRSRGRFFFKCQHGPRECFGNRLHACAIDVLQNNTRSVLFNTCLMQNISYKSDYHHYVSVLRWCGHKENVNISNIWKCANGSRGRILQKKYGDMTHALNPSYVPYLLLDGSTKYQDEATVNLFPTVCRILKSKHSVCQS